MIKLNCHRRSIGPAALVDYAMNLLTLAKGVIPSFR